jgi:hypothetical protein
MHTRLFTIPTLSDESIRNIGNLYYAKYPKAESNSFSAKFHMRTHNFFNPHTRYADADKFKNYSSVGTAWDHWQNLLNLYQGLPNGFISQEIETLFVKDFTASGVIWGCGGGGHFIKFPPGAMANSLRHVVDKNFASYRAQGGVVAAAEVEMKEFRNSSVTPG